MPTTQRHHVERGSDSAETDLGVPLDSMHSLKFSNLVERPSLVVPAEAVDSALPSPPNPTLMIHWRPIQPPRSAQAMGTATAKGC